MSKEPDIKTVLGHVGASKDANQVLMKKFLERISTLEVLNNHLADTLKSCVELFSSFKNAVPPDELQNLLDNIEFALKAVEAVQRNRIRDLVVPTEQHECPEC